MAKGYTKNKIPEFVPHQLSVINPTLEALHNLGGSGTIDEIYNEILKIMEISDEGIDYPHLGSDTQTELQYRLAWARTYLKTYGAITNGGRAVWVVNREFKTVDPSVVYEKYRLTRCKPVEKQTYENIEVSEVSNDEENVLEVSDLPDEIKPWRKRLSDVLKNMDPYGFERLAQRVLRECGFTNVEVTKKSGDGGIDGTGKLKINGIFSFNIAFQCKRHQETVGAPAIRDFRGSLTTSIEKGVFITTGTFTKSAKEEAASPGKQQIDLMDGEEFINKLAEFSIGVKEIKDYEIDEDYFNNI